MKKINRKTFIQMLEVYTQKRNEWIMFNIMDLDLRVNPSLLRYSKKASLLRYSKKAIRKEFFGTVVVKGDIGI